MHNTYLMTHIELNEKKKKNLSYVHINHCLYSWMVWYIDMHCIYCSTRWYIEMWIDFFFGGRGAGGGGGGFKFVLWLEFYLLDLFFSTKLLSCIIEPNLIICPWVFFSSLPPQNLHHTLKPNIKKIRFIFFNTHMHMCACV